MTSKTCILVATGVQVADNTGMPLSSSHKGPFDPPNDPWVEISTYEHILR